MSTILKLKFISSKRQHTSNPVLIRRNKLAAKLHEQAELVAAKKEGRTYAPMRARTVVDRATGDRKTVDLPKRVKEWFWVSENGKINLAVRFGSNVLEITKGKNAIECGNADELLQALNLLKTATLNGELDEQMELASKALKERFKA